MRNISTETYSLLADCESLSSFTTTFATKSQVTSWAPDTAHHAVQVVYTQPTSGSTSWPALNWNLSSGADWSTPSGVAVDAYNPTSSPIKVTFLVYSTGSQNYMGSQFTLPPGASTLVLQFSGVVPVANDYGMASLPPLYFGATLAPHNSYSFNNTFNVTSVTQVRLAMNPADVAAGDVTLKFDSLRTLNAMTNASWLSSLVDKYGQFTGRTYTGKATADSDLTSQYSSEHTTLLANPGPSGRDAYGGSTSYSITGTGFFKTYKDTTSGKWWLIDPAGNYFYSIGANAVLGKGMGATMVSQTVRTPMFLNLPSETDTNYGQFYNLTDTGGTLPGFTSGKSYNHFLANVYTKYGGSSSTWSAVQASYRAEADLRLKSWGLNTVGGWSGQSNAATEWINKSTVPYTIAIGSGTSLYPVNYIEVPGRTPVPDAYDPKFADAVLTRVTWAANTKDSTNTVKMKDDPYFMGYFIDNELGWRSGSTEAAAPTTAGGPHSLALVVMGQTGTPAKNAFVAQLKAKYGATWNGSLSTAWNISFGSWSAVEAAVNINAATGVTTAMATDFKAFISAFAVEYFSKVKAAIHAVDPNHLYLGCRFATPPVSAWNFTDEILVAAGDYCDVVSFNVYGPPPSTTLTSKFALCDAPIMISETSIQAVDQDHFSDLLVPSVATQADRATAARTLMDAYAADPNIVGFHWFCWSDQPVVGIPWEGENFNSGLVSITDRPYTGLLSEFNSFSTGIYSQRTYVPGPLLADLQLRQATSRARRNLATHRH